MLLDNFFSDLGLGIDELGFVSFKDSVEDNGEVDAVIFHIAKVLMTHELNEVLGGKTTGTSRVEEFHYNLCIFLNHPSFAITVDRFKQVISIEITCLNAICANIALKCKHQVR